MFYVEYLALVRERLGSHKKLITALVLLLLPAFACPAAEAQSYQRVFDTGEKVLVSIKNRDGRISVVVAEDQQQKVTLEAKSAGQPVEPTDVTSEAKGSKIQIDVRQRGERDRIDLVVHVPSRSKVEVESE